MAVAAQGTPTLGPIEPHVLYPLDDLKARSGMGTAALRSLRREGMPIRYAGGRGYVLGRDFIDHVMKHGKPER